MRILLFLGNSFFLNNRVGVGAYHALIINQLQYEYEIIVPSKLSVSLPTNAVPLHLTSLRKKIISILKWFLPVDFFFSEYDIIITDSFSFKKRHSSKMLSIMLIHDCMAFTEPQNYSLKSKLYTKLSATTYRHANKIIAVSQNTKEVLHTLFHIPFNKIIVIPNVTNFSIKNIGLKTGFLFIGDMRKTKNLTSLINGFALYLQQTNSHDILTIAGNKKYEYKKLVQLVTYHQLQENVFFTGYISDEIKKQLFSQSYALVLLSDNEGFGIPLIEAAINGLPVLCSDIPVFNEILDESIACFVDNKNIIAIAEGLKKVRQMKIDINSINNVRKKYSIDMFTIKINSVFNFDNNRDPK